MPAGQTTPAAGHSGFHDGGAFRCPAPALIPKSPVMQGRGIRLAFRGGARLPFAGGAGRAVNAGAFGRAGDAEAWIAKDANAITGIGFDIGKTAAPLNIWGMELKFTIPELISAQKAGRPVDAQKYEGMKLHSGPRFRHPAAL